MKGSVCSELMLHLVVGDCARAHPTPPPSHSLTYLLKLTHTLAHTHSLIHALAPSHARTHTSHNAGKVAVTVAESGGATYHVDATVTGMAWKAFLTPAPAGGSFIITATDGTNTANISDVTFGDVW
jgi:hypothetical protein